MEKRRPQTVDCRPQNRDLAKLSSEENSVSSQPPIKWTPAFTGWLPRGRSSPGSFAPRMSTGADSLFSSLLQASHPSPIKESAKVKVQAGHGRSKIRTNATDDGGVQNG